MEIMSFFKITQLSNLLVHNNLLIKKLNHQWVRKI